MPMPRNFAQGRDRYGADFGCADERHRVWDGGAACRAGAAAGGPLALVDRETWIELDVPGRQVRLDVDDKTLAERRAQWQTSSADRSAATGGGCKTLSTYCKRTKVRTWIFWQAAAEHQWRGIRIDGSQRPQDAGLKARRYE